MSSLANAIALLEAKKAEINQKIAIIEQAIKIYTDSFNGVIKQPREPKPIRYIKLDDITIKKKRGRPAKVLYVEAPVQEKREKLTLDEKIMRILRQEYRFLTMEEITASCMQKYSEKLLSRDEVSRKVSDTLNGMLSQKKLVLRDANYGNGAHYWGFEEWLNRKGEPQFERRFAASAR